MPYHSFNNFDIHFILLCVRCFVAYDYMYQAFSIIWNTNSVLFLQRICNDLIRSGLAPETFLFTFTFKQLNIWTRPCTSLRLGKMNFVEQNYSTGVILFTMRFPILLNGLCCIILHLFVYFCLFLFFCLAIFLFYFLRWNIFVADKKDLKVSFMKIQFIAVIDVTFGFYFQFLW